MPDYRLKLYRAAWCVVWRDGGEAAYPGVSRAGRGGGAATRRASLRTADRAEAERRFADFLKSLAVAPGTVAGIYAAYAAEKAAAASGPRIAEAWKALSGTFAALRPDQVTRALCRRYIADRRARGRAPGTIAKELSCLRAALRWHDPRTPAVIVLPQAAPPRDRHLTRAEFAALRDACAAPHLRLFVVLALATAARSRALLDLTWDRVDFARGRIDLRLAGAATRKGRAVVPMNDTARAALDEAFRARTTGHVVEYAGGPVARIAKGFRAAAARAGLDGVTPHVLRHTAAVWMAEDGVAMTAIAQYLGHADSRLTERVYARFSPDFLAAAARALDA